MDRKSSSIPTDEYFFANTVMKIYCWLTVVGRNSKKISMIVKPKDSISPKYPKFLTSFVTITLKIDTFSETSTKK
jgi:hypothetical protein